MYLEQVNDVHNDIINAVGEISRTVCLAAPYEVGRKGGACECHQEIVTSNFSTNSTP
jgi:hypothetical protein